MDPNAHSATDKSGNPLQDKGGNQVGTEDVMRSPREPVYDWKGNEYKGKVYGTGGKVIREGIIETRHTPAVSNFGDNIVVLLATIIVLILFAPLFGGVYLYSQGWDDQPLTYKRIWAASWIVVAILFGTIDSTMICSAMAFIIGISLFVWVGSEHSLSSSSNGKDTEPIDTGICLRLTFLPLSLAFVFTKPAIRINGEEYRRRWGKHYLPLKPGRYDIHIHIPYTFIKANPAETNITIAEHQIVGLHYDSNSIITILPGKITLES